MKKCKFFCNFVDFLILRRKKAISQVEKKIEENKLALRSIYLSGSVMFTAVNWQLFYLAITVTIAVD